MRILFFLPNIDNMGGVERASLSLLNQLAEVSSIEVSLLVLNFLEKENNFFISPKLNIISLGIRNYKFQYFQLIKGFKSIIKQNNIDILVNVEVMSLLFTYPSLLFLKNRPKLIVWEHFNFLNNNGRSLRDYFRKLASKKADLIVTLTETDVNIWKENLCMKSDITYIYNISPYQEVKPKYCGNSKTAIAVGRYVHVKGFERLIKAWSIFQKKYHVTDWELKLIGFGEGKNDLALMIDDEGVSVSLVDGTKNLEALYASASFYCMSSYFEGLPMVMIEAQSFGLPVIAFDIYSGPSEIILGNSGLLIEDGNIEAYADGIYDLIMNKEERIKKSREAEMYSVRFHGDNIAKSWIENFNKLLS